VTADTLPPSPPSQLTTCYESKPKAIPKAIRKKKGRRQRLIIREREAVDAFGCALLFLIALSGLLAVYRLLSGDIAVLRSLWLKHFILSLIGLAVGEVFRPPPLSNQSRKNKTTSCRVRKPRDLYLVPIVLFGLLLSVVGLILQPLVLNTYQYLAAIDYQLISDAL